VCSEALDKLNLNQQRNVSIKSGEKSFEGVSVHWHDDRFSMICLPKSFPNKMLDVINKTRSLGGIHFPAAVLARRNLIPMSSCEDVISTLQDGSSTEYCRLLSVNRDKDKFSICSTEHGMLLYSSLG